MASPGSKSGEEVKTFSIELTDIHIFGYCFFTWLWQIEIEGAINKERALLYSIVQGKFKFISTHFKVTTSKYVMNL